MAILRGGTRIFGQDIRIGLPRDNTLTRGGILKRASELPGKSIGASESTIGRFMANIGQGEGMARPTRYLVRFNMPNNFAIIFLIVFIKSYSYCLNKLLLCQLF